MCSVLLIIIQKKPNDNTKHIKLQVIFFYEEILFTFFVFYISFQQKPRLMQVHLCYFHY